MTPPPPTTFTSDTITMSSNPLSPPAMASTQVPADQYNTLLARLDAEVLTRTQLEADLAAAREQAAYLQRRLVSLGHADARPPAPPENFQTPSKHHIPKPEPRLAPRESKPQDKEILSHCSDISNVRSPDTNSLAKSASAHRKSSSNLTAMNGGVKKTKGKKERAPKVKIPGQSRYWTPEEHKLFLEALNKYGHKDLRSISAYVGTRNMTQVRTHSQKYFMRLMREAKRQNPANKADETTVKDNPPTSTNVKPSSANTSERGDSKDESGDKYSVPNTCGMTLLCLVGQDTLPV